ncbi:MAG TPA: M14 family zinc carboxypeptidase [Steroidobacteraceae bacterium]|nr:M14 family zinc carboxypeptidase [Steroidobacteraceae bacterium]
MLYADRAIANGRDVLPTATFATYKENLMLTRLLRILSPLLLSPALLLPVMLWPALLHAQAAGPDTPEAGSVEEIARATTETRFLSPWVSYLPASATVVSPRAFLHRIPGAPGELVDSTAAYAYSRALAASSPRVKVFTIGRSEEGRDIILLAIADEAGIQQLDKLKAITAALADPRKADPAAAEQLVAAGRPVYYFNAALHSDETGSTETVLELAYRLATSEQPQIRRIRANLIVLINPVSNPDGRDKQVEWFYRYLKGKTVLENLPRQAPPYWSKYAFVDINRDAHQQVHETTKAVYRMLYEWHPIAVHDLHESEALLLTWNGTGPVNEHIDPLSYSERLELSFHEVQTLTGLGMPGVWTWNFGDDFAHLFLDSIGLNHNAMGRGYETYGNGTAETLTHTLNADETTVDWYRPVPPPTGSFRWSARDNLNYMETAALAALDRVAQEPKTLLKNFYLKGLHSYEAGLNEAPYGFLIPEDQGDPTRVAQLVARLISLGIEVHRAAAPVTLKDGSYPAGTYVIRLDQPYRNYAVDLLTPSFFAKDAGEPYDDVSWELPAHYHLKAIPTADPQVRAANLTLLTTAPHPAGEVSGTGTIYVLKDTGQEGLLEARFKLARFKVSVAERSFNMGGGDYPAGSWILPAQTGLASAVHDAATQLGLNFVAVGAVPDVASHAAPVPRLGVWVPWADTDTIGWLRYSLDQRHIPYIYVRDEDIRAGKLRDKYDVLLYGHVDLELAEQIQGIPKAWGPMAFKKTRATPSLGTPAESDDITGGVGWSGLAEVQRFVDSGGLLITLGNGSMLPLEGGIVRGVRREAGGVPRSTAGGGAAAAAAANDAVTRTPGAHLRVSFARPDHPIAYGYPTHTEVFRQNFALYATPRRWLRMAYCTSCLDGPVDPSGVVLQWGDVAGQGGTGQAGMAQPFVISGQAWGESNLIGRPAIFDLPQGAGHVVAFNFNPLHRDLNRGDQRMLWNAIINWRAILAPVAAGAGNSAAPVASK